MGSHLPPDTSEHTLPDRPVLDLPTPEGWKAELYTESIYPHADGHPSKY